MDNDLLKFGMKVWLISIVVIAIMPVTAILCLASTEHKHIPSKGETWYEQEEASATSMLGIYCIECGEYLGEQTPPIKSVTPENIFPDTVNRFDRQEAVGGTNQGQGDKGQGSQGKGQGQQHGKGKGLNK